MTNDEAPWAGSTVAESDEPIGAVKAEPDSAPAGDASEHPSASQPRRFARPLKRKGRLPAYAGALVFMGVWLFVILIGSSAAGVFQGLQDREQSAITSSAEHKAKALAYLQQGNLELAIVELTEARRLNPNDPEIAALIAQLQTPVPQTTPTPAPSATANTVSQAEALATAFAEASKAYTAKDFETALSALENLRRNNPDYHRSEVEEMLYNAYVGLARQYLTDKRFEEAVQRFDKALAIRQSAALLTERNLAANYFRGLSARGADWSRAIDAFAAVVRVDPKYYDAYTYLYEARVQYGDVLVARNSPCQAAEQYAAAIVMGVNAELQSKQAAATAACNATAGATPAPNATGTHVAATPARGSTKYTISVQPGYQATGDPEASIRGVVSDRNGRPILGLEITLFSNTNYKTIATTGIDGGYNFDGLSPGSYGVRISEDPASTSPLINIPAKQRAIINFSAN